MKNAIEIGFLTASLLVLSGCAQFEKASNWVHTAEVETEIIDGQEVKSTNWVVNPKLETGITIAGDIAPFPGNLISEGILALLGIGAALRGRQWKKAAVDAVDAGQNFRYSLNKSNRKSTIDLITDGLKTQQKVNGTFNLIRSILRKL